MAAAKPFNYVDLIPKKDLHRRAIPFAEDRPFLREPSAFACYERCVMIFIEELNALYSADIYFGSQIYLDCVNRCGCLFYDIQCFEHEDTTETIAETTAKSTTTTEMAFLTHAEAKNRLQAVGISAWQSQGCETTNKCTSFEQIRSATIAVLINFQIESGITGIIVTGGTENGHNEKIPFSHKKGYKLDISKNAQVESYIKNTNSFSFYRVHPTVKTWTQYKDLSGNVWTNEGNHWDIVVK